MKNKLWIALCALPFAAISSLNHAADVIPCSAENFKLSSAGQTCYAIQTQWVAEQLCNVIANCSTGRTVQSDPNNYLSREVAEYRQTSITVPDSVVRRISNEGGRLTANPYQADY